MEWKLTSDTKPKSTLATKKAKKPTKKAGLGSKKVTNLNFEQLESDSKQVVQQQEREKAFISASNKAKNADNDGHQTTINSKPISEQRRKDAAARLGIGGINTGSSISSHMLDFQEIRQIEPNGVSKISNNSALSSTENNTLNHSSEQPKTSTLDNETFRLLKSGNQNSIHNSVHGDIMENSSDISDLLGRAKIGSKSGGISGERDGEGCIEIDQYGLVTKE